MRRLRALGAPLQARGAAMRTLLRSTLADYSVIAFSTSSSKKDDGDAEALCALPTSPLPFAAASRSAMAASTCGPSCAYARTAGPAQGAPQEAAMRSLARHYVLDVGALSPPLRAAVRPLPADDAETAHFIRVTCEPNWLQDWLAGLLRALLRWSLTDVNAILGRGQMFVLSTAQAQQLLPFEGGPGGRRLLDVGAGDGGVTARLRPLFSHVTCTEVSQPMCRRLRTRTGVVDQVVHSSALARAQGAPFDRDGAFDCVSLFNVIDRCDHPAELLRDACRLVRRDGGRLLLAVVLPFSEFVETDADRRAPRGPLPMKGARCGDGVSLEASLDALLRRVLLTEPLGGEAFARKAGAGAGSDADADADGPHMVLERLARVPYLCRGDTTSGRRFFVLSDAIVVLRHATDEELRARRRDANVAPR